MVTPKKGAKVKVLARFAEDDGPAIVALTKGRGRVLLSGVHLETWLGRDRSETGWPEGEVEKPDPESDRDLLLRGLRWILKD